MMVEDMIDEIIELIRAGYNGPVTEKEFREMLMDLYEMGYADA